MGEQLLTPCAEAVEGAHAHQVVADLAAHVCAGDEVGQRRVGLLLHDRPHGGRAHLLGILETHAQRLPIVLHAEALLAQVHVQRQDAQPPAARVVEHHARRVEAHRLIVEQAAVELGRVVRLEPGAGVADDGKAGGVRLVEAVGGEAAQLAEHFFGGRALDAARDRLLDEVTPDLVHLLHRSFVGHRPSQQVAFGQAEAGHCRRHFYDLLLVEDDAVGALEHGPHGRVRHGGCFAAVPPPYERPDHLGLQRPRPEQRDGRDHVFEVLLAQACGQVALTGALELEHAHRARRADELVHGRVVARQLPG